MNRYLDAKSIHIFAWPFLIEDEDKKNPLLKKIENKGWIRKEFDYNKKEYGKTRLKEDFMLRQYLSISAKNVFLKEESKACTIFHYPLRKNDAYKYCIEASKGKVYELYVEAIELHIYSYGVGILFFKTLNMDKKTKLEDIKLINDLGRRISLPFIPNEEDGYIICAESLGIKSESMECITCFRDRVKAFYGGEKALDELEKRADFLEYTLNCNLEQCKKNDISVQSTADDRMFIFTLIRDKKLSEEIKEKKYEEDSRYSIIFIDSDEATCQSEAMREELMKQACYTRWEDYGTLYGVTNYSFVCMTTSSQQVDASVVTPFYVEYFYILSLVLAQKTAIMHFSVGTENIAKLMLKKKGIHKLIDKKIARGLIDLQEEYISFKNRMLIMEVSCQEQGVELYQLLQKQLMVDEEKNILDEQLQGMYEVVNTSNGTRDSWWALIVSIAALIVSILLPLLQETMK